MFHSKRHAFKCWRATHPAGGDPGFCPCRAHRTCLAGQAGTLLQSCSLTPLARAPTHPPIGQAGGILVADFPGNAGKLLAPMLVGCLQGVVLVCVHPGDDVGQLGGLVKHQYRVVQSQVHVGELAVVFGGILEGELACTASQAAGQTWPCALPMQGQIRNVLSCVVQLGKLDMFAQA